MRRALIERARGGDRGAFASLASDSIGRLFNVAQLMLHDRDLAEDAVQETLVQAWRDLRGLRVLDVSDASRAADASAALADRDQLDRGFRRLRPEHRAVLVLHHYLGFSDDE